jgi:hypothetical protein
MYVAGTGLLEWILVGFGSMSPSAGCLLPEQTGKRHQVSRNASPYPPAQQCEPKSPLPVRATIPAAPAPKSPARRHRYQRESQSVVGRPAIQFRSAWMGAANTGLPPTPLSPADQLHRPVRIKNPWHPVVERHRHLPENGGNVVATLEIGRQIRLQNWTTTVPADAMCASSCALAWFGGTRRLEPAQLGFVR